MSYKIILEMIYFNINMPYKFGSSAVNQKMYILYINEIAN